jgi:hypothetical protein
MLNPHLHEGASAAQASGQDFALVCNEPSHIHIPRPSRLNRASLAQPASEIEPPIVVPLDLAVEQAA